MGIFGRKFLFQVLYKGENDPKVTKGDQGKGKERGLRNPEMTVYFINPFRTL